MQRLTIATLALGLLAAPAFAQDPMSSTMNPPAPNAGVGIPEPTNSLPPGAGTATRQLPGAALTTAPTTPLATAPSNSAGTTQAVPPPTNR